MLGGGYVAWNVFGMSMPTPTLPRSDAQVAVRPLSGAKPGAPAPLSTGAPTAEPTAEPQATPTSAPKDAQQAVVTGTEGTGVVLRATPRDSDWTPRGFMDGAQVQVLERQGPDWARVRGPNGQEGWVPARYLAPR
jgi:hypothetical protein